MKLTVSQVREAYDALQRLGKIPFTGVTAYRIAKLTKALKPTAEAFDEAQGALLKVVGEEVKDQPGRYMLKDTERWAKEMKEMGAEEADIESSVKFRLADFGEEKIEPSIFVALDPFVDGEA